MPRFKPGEQHRARSRLGDFRPSCSFQEVACEWPQEMLSVSWLKQLKHWGAAFSPSG